MMASRYEVPVDHEVRDAHTVALAMIASSSRVLELGAAGGHVTKALVDKRCQVTAVENDSEAVEQLRKIAAAVVVGDLNDPATLANIPGTFDVVLAGDVLEHLLDPVATLRQAVEVLGPEGRVVVSLPNIAHIDVCLELIRGRFEYRPVGLLDSTHIRFFTLKSVQDLVRSAGLVITDLQRIHIPTYNTELLVNAFDVPRPVVDEILKHPEAETYQFVFTAVVDRPGDPTAELAERYDEVIRKLAWLESEWARERAALQAEVYRSEKRAEKITRQRDEARRNLRTQGPVPKVPQNRRPSMRAARLLRRTLRRFRAHS